MSEKVQEMTLMSAKSFTRKADGSRFHRFMGIMDPKRSLQIYLEGAAADTLADVLVPAAAAKGAYLTLVFDDGFEMDRNPETYTNDAGTVVANQFADRPVYNVRTVKDGAKWILGEAKIRPTAKAAMDSDALIAEASKLLDAIRPA